MNRKCQLGLLAGLYLIFIAASWGMLWTDVNFVVTPLGAMPILILACGMIGNGALIGSVISAVVIYGLIFCSLFAIGRGKRLGAVFLTILMTMDLAANVIFTVSSWWCLMAAGLDLLLAALVFRLAFQTK